MKDFDKDSKIEKLDTHSRDEGGSLESSENPKTSGLDRRKAVKAVSAGGAVAGLSAFSGQWTKPVIDIVVLPAHAAASPTLPPGPPSLSDPCNSVTIAFSGAALNTSVSGSLENVPNPTTVRTTITASLFNNGQLVTSQVQVVNPTATGATTGTTGTYGASFTFPNACAGDEVRYLITNSIGMFSCSRPYVKPGCP